MVDTRYPISGNLRMWYTPANGFANPKSPTKPELDASLDISDAVSWNDTDFGTQASTTNADPAITAKGNTQTRGAAQYGGSLSLYYPADFNDNSNLYKLAFDALGRPSTPGFITVRADGMEALTNVGDASHPGIQAGSNDIVSVYKVATAGYAESITGEEAFRYTVSFLPKGMLASRVVVRATAAAPTVTLLPATLAGAAGAKAVLVGRVNTRIYTPGLRYVSSNQNVARVSRAGVVSYIAAGSATITGTHIDTGTAATAVTVTVS